MTSRTTGAPWSHPAPIEGHSTAWIDSDGAPFDASDHETVRQVLERAAPHVGRAILRALERALLEVVRNAVHG
jgi:hypothetical protein